jgi:hypothetical protein
MHRQEFKEKLIVRRKLNLFYKVFSFTKTPSDTPSCYFILHLLNVSNLVK